MRDHMARRHNLCYCGWELFLFLWYPSLCVIRHKPMDLQYTLQDAVLQLKNTTLVRGARIVFSPNDPTFQIWTTWTRNSGGMVLYWYTSGTSPRIRFLTFWKKFIFYISCLIRFLQTITRSWSQWADLINCDLYELCYEKSRIDHGKSAG